MSCTTKDQDNAPTDMRASTSDVMRTANPILEPTRPEGGLVKGRIAPVSAQESADRVARNKKQPIIWGQSVGGITMETEYTQSLEILSEALGKFQNFHYYTENIRVAWAIQDKRTPESIIVDVGYQGALGLSSELGEMRLGDSFKSRFPVTDSTGQDFIRALSRAIEKMAPGFDCLTLNVCKIVVDADYIEFSFRNGGMLFTNDANRTLSFVYFTPQPAQMTTPLTQPLVFGDSVAGINMGMTYHQARAILGTAAYTSGMFSFYDNGNVGVAWDMNGSLKPMMILIDRGYQGSWDLPAPLDTLRLNTDMSAHFPQNDPTGTEILKTLGRIFDGKTDLNYDCRLVNSCQVAVAPEGIEFIFDKGGVVFDSDAKKRLSTVYFTKAQPARTEPMSTPVVFPTDVVGITMATAQADALTTLGQPRRMSSDGRNYYYDNDNILIVWNSEEPRKPAYIQVNKGHRGALTLPAELGPVLMGQNMSAHFPVSDVKGEALIKTLGRFFRGEAPEYDCLAAHACKIESDNSLIFFMFKEQGFIAFSMDSAKELRFIGFDPAQVVTE